MTAHLRSSASPAPQVVDAARPRVSLLARGLRFLGHALAAAALPCAVGTLFFACVGASYAGSLRVEQFLAAFAATLPVALAFGIDEARRAR